MRKLKTERQPEILDAALAIADERGLDALTMRAVAERIGLTPMAIYGYFRNKDELLDGLVARLLTSLPQGLPGEPWDQRLTAFAWGTRRLAREHPGVFPLLFARPSVTPDAVRVVDWIYQALIDAGVPDADVPRIERLLSTFVIGFATSEANGRFSTSGQDIRSRRARGDFPAHQRLIAYLDTPGDLDAEFAADLADLVRIIRPV